jgi:hypothetical protein
MKPMSQGPAHHDGGSLAGKDSLFDSSTGSRTGSASAGLLIGRPTASSSLIATAGRGRDARSGFMSHTMARCGAWRPGSCATRRVAALTRAHLAAVDPRNRAGGAPPAGARAGVAGCERPVCASYRRRRRIALPPDTAGAVATLDSLMVMASRSVGRRPAAPLGRWGGRVDAVAAAVALLDVPEEPADHLRFGAIVPRQGVLERRHRLGPHGQHQRVVRELVPAERPSRACAAGRRR